MAAPLFVKRAKPGAAGAAARRRQHCSESGDEGFADDDAPAPVAAGKRRLALDEEESGDAFRVKKSKLSKKMTKDKTRGLHSSASSRRLVSKEKLEIVDSASEEEAPTVTAATDAVPVAEVTNEPGLMEEDSEDSEEERRRARAVRLAKAQRASARELGEKPADVPSQPKEDEFIPLVAPKKVATPPPEPPESRVAVPLNSAITTLGAAPDPEDEADAWALQQMRVGAHRRYSAPQPPRPASKAPSEPMPGTAMSGLGLGKKKDLADPIELQGSIKTPAKAMAGLWESISRIEGGVGEREKESASLEEQEAEARQQLQKLAEQASGLETRLRAVQELESLSWGLGGLLDSKAPKLKQASQTLAGMERDFSQRRTRRRALAIARELRGAGAALSAPMPASEVDEEEDKEKKPRQRRRRGGKEGWETSSMSEEDGLQELADDRAAFCTAAERQIAADVDENFASATAVLKPLARVKEQLEKEYSQAYLPQSLPEVLGLHVQHSLLWWDPLDSLQGGDSLGPKKRVGGTQLEGFDWFEDLAAYTEMKGEKDPDAALVPQLVESCVFPEVARRLKECWDVTSGPQSASVAALLDECTLFETDPATSAFPSLQQAALERVERALAELAPEVFVARDALSRWYASEARRRLLWRSCKIGHCALRLEGRVPEEALMRIVLGRVFTARIAPHLRSPRLDPEEMALLEQLCSALPQGWLEAGLPKELQPLRDALGPKAPKAPEALATAEAAVRILRSLRCFDEAQVLAESARLG